MRKLWPKVRMLGRAASERTISRAASIRRIVDAAAFARTARMRSGVRREARGVGDVGFNFGALLSWWPLGTRERGDLEMPTVLDD